MAEHENPLVWLEHLKKAKVLDWGEVPVEEVGRGADRWQASLTLTIPQKDNQPTTLTSAAYGSSKKAAKHQAACGFFQLYELHHKTCHHIAKKKEKGAQRALDCSSKRRAAKGGH
eukprot:Skav203846  [mRNA]  locus=scaffold5703:35488:35832:+ [translate_table: standard]